tara:strand:- start:1529 stop:2119 length:591 start_codon:yes stop_codon:yes gene_type:complete
MHKIGITGGISSGKSAATKIFKDKKESFIYNADKESKKHLKNSHSLQKKLINVFGNQITLKNKLNIELLAKVAFSNKTNHKILNGIMWPEIYLLINKEYNNQLNKNYKFFVVDAALIFEANFQNFFDKIILITAKKDLRIERAVKRNNIQLESIQNRISLQMSDNKKRQLADYIVTNNTNLVDFYKKIEKIYKTFT